MKRFLATMIPVLALLFSASHNGLRLSQDGGQGVVWCDARLFNFQCKAIVVNNTCEASVTRYALFGRATNVKSQVSQKNCNQFVDNLGFPCRATAEQRVLPFVACKPHLLVIPFL